MQAKLNPFRKVAANSSLALVLKGISLPLGYVSNLVMARFFGAEQMGNYFIALNLATILAIFCTFGLDKGVLRFAASLKAQGSPGGVRQFIWPVFAFGVLLGVVCAAITIGARDLLAERFHSPTLPMMLLLVICTIPLAVATRIFAEAVRALDGIKWVVLQQQFLTPVLLLVFLLILIISGLNVRFQNGAIGLAFLGQTIIGVVFLYCCYYFITPKIEKKNDKNYFNDILKYSFPIFLASFFSLCFNFLDSIILGLYTSPEQVAYYGVATKIAPFVGFSLVAVNAVVPPLFAEYFQNNDMENLERMAQTTARWMYFISIPIVLIIILLGPEILKMFGRDFLKAQFALSILAFSQLINVTVGSVGVIMWMTNLNWYYMVIQSGVGVCALPLLLVFASTWGINGVALVSALALIASNVLMAWIVWRRLKVKAFAQRIGWANLGGIAGVVLFFLAKPWIGSLVGGLIFAATYTLFVLKPLKQEISMLRQQQWLGA